MTSVWKIILLASVIIAPTGSSIRFNPLLGSTIESPTIAATYVGRAAWSGKP